MQAIKPPQNPPIVVEANNWNASAAISELEPSDLEHKFASVLTTSLVSLLLNNIKHEALPAT